eukprot:jgi/Astpho2/3772/Aster-04947
MAALNIEKLRLETPAVGKGLVHLNNAGAALQPQPVVAAVHQFLDVEDELGGYEAAAEQQQALQRPYDALARMLNCSPDNIAVLVSATSAWGQVFQGILFSPGDVVLTSVAEYGSNMLAYLQARDALHTL